jgi:hypothetical protein
VGPLSAYLANAAASPIAVIQRSASFDGEADLVLLEDGEEEDEYRELDVSGKVVLTRGDLHRVVELAVQQRGAIGVLYDGMRQVAPVRPEGDLDDVRQYTSFWWRPGDTHCFGFVLTPRQGRALRRLLKNGDKEVRVRARVRSRLYDGAMEVVQADLPGETDEVVFVVAHLCHPQPSANDNASGAAAAFEAARTLNRLIAEGSLPRPRRTIRFLWLPEMTGTYAYLSQHESEIGRYVGGINLDMVGEDQNQTGSSWLIERPPDAAASYAAELLACLRDEMPGLKGMTGIAPSHTGIGGYPLYRQAEVPFSGGSDHFILSDPSVDVPTPMLIQWPDRFYHTAADTPDRTDPQSLARSGALAAMYAYWLAVAEAPQATWLGYQMAARFKARLLQASQAAVSEALAATDGESLAGILAGLDRRLAYQLHRQNAALATLQRIASVDCLVRDLQAEAERAMNRELSWASRAVDLQAAALDLQSLPAPQERVLTDKEQAAAAIVPVRTVPGPASVGQHLHRLDADVREEWRSMVKARKGRAHHSMLTLALYWADGRRSLLEIADLVEMECGLRDLELMLAQFRLLETLGFVRL